MGKLHPIQKNILEIAEKYDLRKMSLGQIARLVGESYPQTAKYHISRLKKNGFLDKNLKPKYPQARILKVTNGHGLIAVPIIGAANCGEANLVAEENLEGFLKVSPRVIGGFKQAFILRAEGDSMNRADVYGRNIEDGDYVLVDGSDKTPRDRDYVVSIIDGAANIKKFVRDEENNQIILFSESTEEYPPICIHEEDLSSYAVVGTVKQVIKSPKVEELKYEPIIE